MTLEEWARLALIEKVKISGFNAKYPDLLDQLNQITSFLPLKANIRQRLWHILYGLDIPKCKICNEKEVNFSRKGKYSDYCSQSCRMHDPVVINKSHKKAKQTKLERYGDENYNNREQQNKTYIERYGSIENAYKFQEEQRNKSNLEKYGVKNNFQREDVKEKNSLRQLGEDKKEQLSEENLRKLYVEEQRTINEIKDIIGVQQKTLKKLLEKYNIPLIIKRAGGISLDKLEMINDVNNLKKLHYEDKKSLKEIERDIGLGHGTLSKIFKRNNIPVLNIVKKSSNQEKEVYKFIKQHIPNESIITNSKQIIRPFELDIYIPSKNIAIEYCGLFWHSLGSEKKTPYSHLNKLEKCLNKDIRLLTIFEDEWMLRRKQTESKILRILGVSKEKRIGARKTHISSEISFQQCNLFLEENHIQGGLSVNPTYSFGLLYENELIALMTFIKRKDAFELNRFATSCIIPGAFSKLLKFAKSKIDDNVFSFADRRWSEGGLYEKNGFILDKILPPDYSYIENNERHHKFNYRHKYLKNKFENYDSNLSEQENCARNRIFRIYNCGLIKYKF
jgi:hypothetical protein